MFDKLIESNSEGAEFKNRRSYFMVSSVVVGLLFLAAVVVSIYAADFSLGYDDLELTIMTAPVAMPEDQPEPPRPQAQNHETQQVSDVPTRQTNMVRLDESPITPTSTSVVNNTQIARPADGRQFDLASGPETNGAGPIGVGRENTGDPNGTGLSNRPEVAETRDVTTTPEPPKSPKPVTQSLGVINGRAASLPKPPYPAAAIAINAQGKVDVQVTIDEDGKVIAAKAVSGHPLLRPAAEKAAWGAKFTPTMLSKVPVKVTGVIVYNFTRN